MEGARRVPWAEVAAVSSLVLVAPQARVDAKEDRQDREVDPALMGSEEADKILTTEEEEGGMLEDQLNLMLEAEGGVDIPVALQPLVCLV